MQTLGGPGCSQCGAEGLGAPGACRARFDELLALDHSRQEPWGSRHGLVFAAYALQHPGDFTRETLERSWLALHRVLLQGDDPAKVFAALRNHPPRAPGEWGVPELPAMPTAKRGPGRTIAELDPMEVEGYADRVTAWCQSALAGWGGTS